jgi:ATP phosphoribosyltransferase
MSRTLGPRAHGNTRASVERPKPSNRKRKMREERPVERLKIGLPKGSLQEATVRLFERAGFRVAMSERSYAPSIDDPELEPMLLRAQEMSRYVEQGILDCGITGNDWILENGSSVSRVAELAYAKRTSLPVRWVLAVPVGSPITMLSDLNGKRIATELVNVTKAFLATHQLAATVEFSWGATEGRSGRGWWMRSSS